jgi:hypothetical protein
MRTCRLVVRLSIGFALAVVLSIPTHGQTWLLDFGGSAVYRSISTPSPDSSGHYWNNIGYGYIPGMIDMTGATTSMAYGPDGSYGTDSYNGPAGDTSAGLSTVANTVFNPSALGNLGQTNAVYDYFSNITFQLQGLDPTKQYQLTFFGSHKYNANNTTAYSICSDSTYSTVLQSTTLLVGVNAAHNQDQVATLIASPQANTIMYIKVGGAGGTGTGYLNAMQIQVVPEPATFALVGLGLLGLLALRRRHAA